MFELGVTQWLESAHLRRIAMRVSYAYHLPAQDAPDLYQELCLALWKAGANRKVNATWVFHTANHHAVRLLRRNRLAAGIHVADYVAHSRDPELELLVRARVDRMPKPLRRFYEMRFEAGMSQQELISRHHLTRGSVRSLERQCARWIAQVAM